MAKKKYKKHKKTTKRKRSRNRPPSVGKSIGGMVQAVTGLAVAGAAVSVIKNM